MPDLELPEALEISTCLHCGEPWIDDDEAERIASAAERAYKEALLSKAEAAIEALRMAGHAQRDVERLLGLSAGYVSKLRAGERDTSAPLVAALMLLAHDPARTAELRNAWLMRPAVQPQVSAEVPRGKLVYLKDCIRSARGPSPTVSPKPQFRYHEGHEEPQSDLEPAEPACGQA